MLAACSARAREKARMLAVSDGLSEEELGILGSAAACPSLQAAMHQALALKPHAAISLLPRGGD